MQMKIRKSFIILFSAVIAALLISCAFMLSPKTTAHADAEDEGTDVAQVSFDNGGGSWWLSLEDAWESANTYTSATVILLADVETTDTLTVDSDKDITLDLNGHTITGSGNGSVITVSTDAAFTLCDSVGTGIITGGNTTNGGGVYMAADSTFTMTGGTISGNSATNGGGVYVGAYGSFIMTDGEIKNNTATDGGGVFVSSGYFKMSGGTISGNSATNGGGVYVYRSTVEIPPPGGGSGASKIGFEISGAPEITGNVLTDDSSNNVYFMGGRTIRVIGELTDGAQIGVNNTGIVATGFTHNGSDKPSKYFIPDNLDYCVYVSDDDSGTVSIGHDWGEGELIAEPTCTDEGEKTFTCSVCGETKTEPVDKIAHTLTHHTATAATDEKEGNSEYWSCDKCDKYFRTRRAKRKLPINRALRCRN